jgi:uncharacterized protein
LSIVTYEGTVFDYLNPTSEMININDIIRALPRLNRFVGHSSRAYSVGEHTFLCLVMAQKLGYSPREQLLVFVHDFTEAYVGDCPAPLKKLLPDFSVIESKVEHAIYEYIGIEPPTAEEKVKIKSIDLTMLAIEMRDLTLHKWDDFIYEITHLDMLSEPELFLNQNDVSEELIRTLLHELYYQLVEQVKGE